MVLLHGPILAPRAAKAPWVRWSTRPWRPETVREGRSVASITAVGADADRAGARARALLAVGAVLVLIAACSSGAQGGSAASGDTATWELISDVGAESRTLEIGVTRLGCAGGVTGEVLEPRVIYEDTRIVVEVDVAALGDGAYSCPGNDVVPIVVELTEPVRDRTLVDGACLDGEAGTTSFCVTEVRWP